MSGDLLLTTVVLVAGIVVPGLLLGLADRKNFRSSWLVIVGGLVVLNDAALTDAWGLIPDVVGGDYNWQGKFLAFALSLAVAAHPAFGWRRSGLTFSQGSEPRKPTAAVIFAAIALFALPSLLLPKDPFETETLAFQATMPGLEEELFYRGILLLALNEALRGRQRIAGVTVGWGALLVTLGFGMAHGVDFTDGVFDPNWIAMAVSGIPALILIWVRERTGSIVWPIILHNLANTFPLVL